MLGAYGYISQITKVEDRSARLVRNDGFERLANIMGAFLSPVVFTNFGIITNYVVRLSISGLALIYAIFMLKSPPKAKIAKSRKQNELQKYLMQPLKDMFMTLFKKRDHYKRNSWLFCPLPEHEKIIRSQKKGKMLNKTWYLLCKTRIFSQKHEFYFIRHQFYFIRHEF